jgi:adenylate kinase family enzyme/YHS domain-containing protein
MAEVQIKGAESIPKEKIVQFGWDQNTMAVPYYQQGSRKHESSGIADQRNKIKYSSQVRDSINRFWSLAPKNPAGCIEKSFYIQLCLRINKLLYYQFTTESNLAVIEEDWENDCEGNSSLDYTQFYNTLFQLADVWTEEVASGTYSEFLMKVYRRITCKKILESNGNLKIVYPDVYVVFPDNLNKELEWEPANSEEEYDSDYDYNYLIDDKDNKKRVKRLKEPEIVTDTGGLYYDEVVLSHWDSVSIHDAVELADLDKIIPFGDMTKQYLIELSIKSIENFIEVPRVQDHLDTDKNIVVISDSNKHKIKIQISSSFLSLKKSVSKLEHNKSFSGKPFSRRTVHDFSMSILKSESKDTPVHIDQPEKQSIQELRKNMLQAKYQPVIKRIERKVSMQIKKGRIEVDRKRGHNEESEEPLPPIESLRGLYSAETSLPKDPDSNTEDIISVSNQDVIKILIIGPPISGKTTLGLEISKSLDLNHIEITQVISALIAKGKKTEEEEQEDDEEEGKKPEIYSDFEKKIIDTLLNGDDVSIADMITLLEKEIASDVSQSKGIVLDLPLLAPYLQFIQAQTFNLVIHMNLSLQDLNMQNNGIKWDSGTNLVYTPWHISEILKPPVKTDDEDPAEDEGPKIIFENLLNRVEDDPNHYLTSVQNYFQTIEPQLLSIKKSMPESFSLEIKAAGLYPDQIKSIILGKLGHRKNKPPAARKLEGESNFKGLLLQEVEENQEPRSWSIWKQIDPVALYEKKLVQGKPDYAAEYAGHVFVFDSEKNLEKFLINPQKFLKSTPHMPQEFRVCILGPKKSGRHTQAEYLCAKYGWRLVDINEMLQQSIQAQKKNLKDPQPSHPDTGLVQVPDVEFRKILAGESLPANTVLPIILNKLGIPLRKKPPPPPTPKSEAEEGEEENPANDPSPEENEAEEDLNLDEDVKKEDDEAKPDNEITEQGVDNLEEKNVTEEVVEREPTPPIVYEDLLLTDIVLKPQDNINPKLEGFVMIGYPYTEEEAAALKEFNIEFDKVLYLLDPKEGETLIQRGLENYEDVAKEIALVEQAVSVCKEAFTDEIILEIPIDGAETEVHDRICRGLDPFYVYIDDPEVTVSKEEAGEEAIVSTLGEYGPYDPVIFKEHNWLMPGSDEYTVESLGKKYSFVSETEMEKFKKNPKDYINIAPNIVPPPQVMVLGPRGSGVKTVLKELCEKYQIGPLDLKQKYLEYLDQEKYKRRKSRLLKRGFVPKETTDDEEPYDPIENDPDIVEEDENFDKAIFERKAMQYILKGTSPTFINGKWFEIDEEKVSQGLVDLLYESRRLPELVIILKAPEQVTIHRLLDIDGITNTYTQLMETRRKLKEKAKEDARREKIEARMERIAAGEEVEELEEEQEEEEQDDPDAPNLESMLEEAKQKLIEVRDSDNTLTDELKESFESKGIKILEISTESDFSRLMQRINYELKSVLSNRSSIVEKKLAIKLKKDKANELLVKSKAKVSRFGRCCPVNPDACVSEDFPVLFRDRIYYPGQLRDQEAFMNYPWDYLSQDVNPADIDLKIITSVLGGPCAGKSTLCIDLNKELGLIRVNLRKSVQQILNLRSELAERVRTQLSNGRSLPDALAVEVIEWRLGLSDVISHGCVLDGFPSTSSQAILLSSKNIIPSPVFYLSCSNTRIPSRLKPKFKHDLASLVSQIDYNLTRTLETVSWYQSTYNNVQYLNTDHSKWWMKDAAINNINQVFSACKQYSISLINKKPVNIKHLKITRHEISKRFGKFKRYDPVTWKYKNELAEVKSNEYIAEYRTRLYAFETFENLQIFIDWPDKILQTRSLPDLLPRKLRLNECGDIYESRIELENNCIVTLAEQGKIERGNPNLLVSYGDKIYSFANNELLNKYMKKPHRYEKTKLPVKLPPKADNMVNFVLDDFETSIGFLDQMLGQVIIKALLDVGTLKLIFPLLSPRETALKHFSLFLKAHNPNNTPYQTQKYSKKLLEFKKHCSVIGELYEEGVRKENNELKDWEIENYYNKSEKYHEFISSISPELDIFIDKLFR